MRAAARCFTRELAKDCDKDVQELNNEYVMQRKLERRAPETTGS